MTPAGLELLKSFEGFDANPYRDTGGILTVGFGTVFPLTRDEAGLLLESRVNNFEEDIRVLVQQPISENRFDALTSFAYNVGIGAFRNSTLLAKLNEGDLEAVPGQMRLWVHDHSGRVQQGLVKRRAAEAALWEKG